MWIFINISVLHIYYHFSMVFFNAEIFQVIHTHFWSIECDMIIYILSEYNQTPESTGKLDASDY